MNINLLFEQSGTFKHVLRETGNDAKDIDISNAYNETDILIDIFVILDRYISGDTDVVKSEIFTSDLIIAFFPCTYFSQYNDLMLSGKWYNYRFMTDNEKSMYMFNRKAMQILYTYRLNALIEICRDKKIPLIIENPVSTYMTKFIKNNNINYVKHVRNKYGDNMYKPTYYLLFNGVYIENLDLIETPITRVVEKIKDKNGNANRSLISKDYVRNFCKHIKIIKG
mgnify:FL=1